jgi:GNAT superfamily N-acetyltransferase
MKDIVVRQATKADLPAMGRLLEELADAMGDTKGIDMGTAVKTCGDLLNAAGSHLLVAEMDGKPMGFVHFAVRQSILHRAPSALIDELVVAEECRGKGVGRELVMAVLEKCKQLGCCEVEVSTEKTNAEAREFYEKCGFEERGVLFEVDL